MKVLFLPIVFEENTKKKRRIRRKLHFQTAMAATE